MNSNKFTVFFDVNTTYPIKIHKIDCVWREKYDEHETTTTEWYDVLDLQAAKEKASQISRENNNRKIVQPKCGGNCFPRN